MNEEEKKALKVINARTRRLLDELEIEKEDMSDEPKIAYLMQEIRANKTILNLIEKLQKENEELKNDYENLSNSVVVKNHYIKNSIPVQKVKDKVEELNDVYNAEKIEDIMNRKNYTITELIQYVLQKLLNITE